LRVIIAGDWHGSTKHALAVIKTAKHHNINTILHLGDLAAFWPGHDVHPETGETSSVKRWHGFTGALASAVRTAGIDFRFIDGNHDNHDFLDSLHRGSRRAVTLDGLTYQPRGSRFTFGGLTFGCLGGAGSIDRAYRQRGLDWWPQEQLTEADVQALGTAPVDVLLTHEVPTGVNVRSDIRLPLWLEIEMQTSRDHLATAVKATQPKLVFSGHWHQRLVENYHPLDGHTEVHVLDMEHTPGNAIILDTVTLTVSPLLVSN